MNDNNISFFKYIYYITAVMKAIETKRYWVARYTEETFREIFKLKYPIQVIVNSNFPFFLAPRCILHRQIESIVKTFHSRLSAELWRLNAALSLFTRAKK